MIFNLLGNICAVLLILVPIASFCFPATRINERIKRSLVAFVTIFLVFLVIAWGLVIVSAVWATQKSSSGTMNGIHPTTMTYDGTGLRRSRQWVQSGATKTTTYVWDGTDYLSEYAY